MTAYYNENDPFAAAWLRELMKEDLIAKGEVDERSIEDVAPRDLDGFTQCHFFAGIGVWSHALRGAGWGDDREVWTGSCPCQPFSEAGKRKGIADERHLWPSWFHLIRQRSPVAIFGEQVASQDGLEWFDLISADLENENYTCGAVDTCAAGFDVDQTRQRLYFVSYSKGLQARAKKPDYSGAKTSSGWKERPSPNRRPFICNGRTYRIPEPSIPFVVDGFAGCVDQIRAIGNSLVAPQAAAFIEAAMDALDEL